MTATMGEVAVLPLRGTPQKTADPGRGKGDEQQLQILLATKLGDAGRPLIGPSQVTKRLAARRDLADCARGACLDELIAFLNAGKLCGGVIRKVGPGLSVELWMYDRDSRESITAEASCARCATKEAPELVERAAADLLAQDSKRRLPATIEVQSQPGGARVMVDGQGVGVTPISLRLAAGPHGIVVERAGYASQSRDIAPAAGEAVELAFTLELASGIMSPPPSAGVPDALVLSSDVPEKKRISPTWKWVAWGGAVAAIGAGAVLLAVHGNEISRTPGDAVGDEEMQEFRNTKTAGAVMISLGGALAVTGAVLWFMEER